MTQFLEIMDLTNALSNAMVLIFPLYNALSIIDVTPNAKEIIEVIIDMISSY